MIDIIRERLEGEADEWFKVLTDARVAERTLVARNGDIAGTEPDHAIRLSALRESLDRSYGRPRQSTEVTGSIGIWDLADEVGE